ncbi:MAG: hypothetical protein ACK46Q_11975, partial [Hyphomonas sp.]
AEIGTEAFGLRADFQRQALKLQHIEAGQHREGTVAANRPAGGGMGQRCHFGITPAAGTRSVN